MNLQDVRAAANAFMEASKGEVVSDDLIQRRAATCKACPLLKRTKGMNSNISFVIGSIANRHRVPHLIKNNMCGVCGCSLLLLIPAKKESLHQDSPEQEARRPSTCWFNWKA